MRYYGCNADTGRKIIIDADTTEQAFNILTKFVGVVHYTAERGFWSTIPPIWKLQYGCMRCGKRSGLDKYCSQACYDAEVEDHFAGYFDR